MNGEATVDTLDFRAETETATKTGSATNLTYSLTTPDDSVRAPTLVKRRLTAGGENALDILTYAAATAELRLQRNARLLGNLTTNPRFVYTTERVAAGDWARPVLQPEKLFVGRSAPATGPDRLNQLNLAVRELLTDVANGKHVDVSARSSLAFDPSGAAVAEIGRLDRATIVPLVFLPERVVSPGEGVDELAAAIHGALPEKIHANNAGVLLELTVFTHPTLSTKTVSPSRRVLTLRGLWIPLQSI